MQLWVVHILLITLTTASGADVASPAQDVLLANDRYGLVLVPEELRTKRSANPPVDPPKRVIYQKRLKHSVHVQTDIRYR